MADENPKKEIISDFPPAAAALDEGVTEDTRRDGEDPVEFGVRSAPVSRQLSSPKQLTENDFGLLNISPVIVGEKDWYKLLYSRVRPESVDRHKAEIFYAQGLDGGEKFVVKRFSDNKQKNFEREKAIQKILRSCGGHENILLSDEFLDQQRMVITPYARGMDVNEIQKRSNAMLTPRQAKVIITGLCDALEYLHKCDIIHRDVKTGNIVLDIDRNLGEITPVKLECSSAIIPKLFDYDVCWNEAVAYLDNPNEAVGTYHYMAPEAFYGKKDLRADLYAAGITAYKLLTRHFPFVGNDKTQILEAHLKDKVPDVTQINPGVSLAVQSVLEKALAKEPEQRYQTAAEFKSAYLEAVK